MGAVERLLRGIYRATGLKVHKITGVQWVALAAFWACFIATYYAAATDNWKLMLAALSGAVISALVLTRGPWRLEGIIED